MRQRRAVLAIISVFLLVAASCGGDGDDQAAADRSPGTTQDPNATLTPDGGSGNEADQQNDDTGDGADGTNTGANTGGNTGGETGGGNTGGGGDTGGGDGGDEAQSGPCTPAPGPYEQGLTQNQIKIGVIEPLSGPLSFIGKPWADAIRAVWQQTNDNGGVCGRKIAWEIRDDKFDSQEGAKKCRELVETEKVWALGPSWSVFTVDACIPYLESKEMHWFLTDGASDAQYKSPYIFPAGVLCTNLGHHIAAHMFKDKGVKNAGVIYINNDVGRACDSATKDAANQYGANIVQSSSVEQTDGVVRYQTILSQMQTSGVDGIVVHGSPTELINTIKAAKNNGSYKPPKGYYASGGAALDLTIENLEGCCADLINGVVSNAPLHFGTSDEPGVKKAVATIQKYFPDADLGTFAMGGYAQAKVFVDALRATGGNLTRQRLADTLRSKEWCHGVGACFKFAPPRFEGGNGQPGQEFLLVEVKNLQWTEISGFQRDDYTG